MLNYVGESQQTGKQVHFSKYTIEAAIPKGKPENNTTRIILISGREYTVKDFRPVNDGVAASIYRPPLFEA